MMILAAEGVLSWESRERRSGRYGSIFVDNDGFHPEKEYYNSGLKALEGHRLKMSVRVVETRQSTHLGDKFLGIQPETPEVSDTIELGVGTFRVSPIEGYEGQALSLEPSDGRETLWFDPRKLYRLHEQTVQIWVESTDEPDHAVPDVVQVEADGAIANGDGTIQVRGDAIPTRIARVSEKLGEGLFLLRMPNENERCTILE
jgi:hypothetical protein